MAFILCKYNIFSGLYYDFIGLLTGALYCTAPQGRIGGIESIQLGQTREIFQTGATMVPPSKTAEKYAYQPCVFSPFCQVYIFYNLYILFHITRIYNPLFLSLQNILSFFLDHIRIYVEKLFPAALQPDAPLWASARKDGSTVDLSSQVNNYN
jgi:hypothetical protein